MSAQNRNRAVDPNAWGLFSDHTVRRFAIVGAIGVLGCIIARAPTILGKFSVPGTGIELNLNAGYVLIFGPSLLLLGILWASSGAGRRAGRPANTDLSSTVIMLLPALSSAFIALQFFLLLAPKGECLTFDRWRYLVDFTLRAFQPEYCMGVSDEMQRSLPWLLNPPMVQGWLQLCVPVAGAAITAWTLRKWRMPRA